MVATYVLTALVIIFIITTVVFIILYARKSCPTCQQCQQCPQCPICPTGYNWTGNASTDTMNLFPAGSIVALYHLQTGKYVTANTSNNALSATASDASSPASQFTVMPGTSTNPGAIKLFSNAFSPTSGVGYVRFYFDGSNYYIDAAGSTGTWSDLYAAPPVTGTQSPPNTTALTLYGPGTLQGTVQNPTSYQYMNYTSGGSSVAGTNATYSSPGSQLALMQINT